MSSCDIEPSKVWNESRVTARKRHACEECDQPIESGETHVRVGSLFDGSWSTFRFCLFCRAFSEQARRAGVCAEIGRLYECTIEWAEDGEWVDGKWHDRWLTDEERDFVRNLRRSAVESAVC